MDHHHHHDHDHMHDHDHYHDHHHHHDHDHLHHHHHRHADRNLAASVDHQGAGADAAAAGAGSGAAAVGSSLGLAALNVVKTYHLQLVAILLVLGLVVWFLSRRRKRRQAGGGTDYAAESSMNVHIRRSRALEAMQAEYDRKAREYEEIKAARQKLEAEERAKRVGVAGDSDGGGGSSSKPKPSRPPPSDDGWTPLMGSGPVGGFKSARACTKRGG